LDNRDIDKFWIETDFGRIFVTDWLPAGTW